MARTPLKKALKRTEGDKGEKATAKTAAPTADVESAWAHSVRTFLRPSSADDRSDTVSSDRNKTLAPRATDDTVPIIVPYGAGIWTFGDHLRHLAAHAGHIPLALDEFGRCVICVRRGFFKPDA